MSTSYKVDLDGRPVFTDPDQGSMIVKMWDIGPQKPNAPVKPGLPEGKEGSPAHDLALIELEGALAKYKGDLQAYGRELRDFEQWHRSYEGPYEISDHSVNVREAMQNDAERYFVSDDRLPNHGLPKGRKPGKWHENQKLVRAEQSRARARELARDPVFGTQGAQI